MFAFDPDTVRILAIIAVVVGLCCGVTYIRIRRMRRKNAALVAENKDRQHEVDGLRESERISREQVQALPRSLDAFAAAPTVDQFLSQLLCTIGRLLNGQWVALWLVSDSDRSLILRAAVKGSDPDPADPEHPFINDPHFWKEDAGLEELFLTGVAVACEDIDSDPRVPSALRTYFKAQGTRKFLRLPAIVAGEVKGFVTIRHAERPPYKREEIEVAQALANQAAFAIRAQQAATLAEINRAAGNVHDTLAQGFTGIVIQLQAASDARFRGLEKEADKHLRVATDLARESLAEARKSVHALRPEMFSDENT